MTGRIKYGSPSAQNARCALPKLALWREALEPNLKRRTSFKWRSGHTAAPPTSVMNWRCPTSLRPRQVRPGVAAFRKD